jgi:L-fuconolactonase
MVSPIRVSLQSPPIPTEIVDAHHHLWHLRDLTPEGILSAHYLRRDFLWNDFEGAWSGLPVGRSVFVQVRSDSDEVSFVERVAEKHPKLGAMIAWAPLELSEAPARLKRLKAHPLVRGVRRNTQHEADPLFCSRAEFVRGARLLGELGYICEICVRHEQIEAAVRLARACPETTIVLEHLGKPDVSGRPPAQWLKATGELSALPNVHCKVSVVVHSDADPRYQAETLAPYIRHAVEAFGWERSLFGSNWPVSTAVIGYPEWVELLEATLPGGSEAEREAFYAGNARRLYRLD